MYRLRQMDVDDKVCEQVNPGVLERIYPTEVIEQCVQASEQWIGTKRRVRQSTALALVLFVMMLALWSRLNQRQVWQKLVGGLSKLHPEDLLCKMSSSALTARRGELGSQVMETLLGTCCHPIARPEQTPEAFFGRYRLMAIDGTLFNVADVEVNEEAFGRSSNQFGKGAYPQVRCVLLAECGTHAVVGIQISRYDESEVHGSHALLHLICCNMLLLVDAGIISAGFVQAVRNRGSHVLASLPWGVWKKGKRHRLSDGSELVQLKPNKRGCYPLDKPIWVRILSYRITDERLGEVGKVYRLVTTLLNPRTAPAKDLVILYHERWEIELVIDEVKTHERVQRKVLRSRTAEGVRQELYGIFLAHYAVRALIYEAACEAGVDPDRLSFTEGMFQLCETIPFAQIMQAQDAEPIRKRLQRDISAVLLPPRLLRVNRREVKQVYNRHKPKKRNLPPPESFLPEQCFEDFVQMVDPLLPAQEEVPSAA
ncbi:MAG TPA: IS4 family transposase [Ktedonobacteraceae bacterium]|nr:IS4 family transposase [Ktedonobacteraceae bacterium]